MSEWSQGDIITNGMRMHYYRTGDGSTPPLVLCHGFSDSGLCWSRVTKRLEADYDVIMIDARGHGLSEAPEGPYGPQSQAADLAGLIRALGLERPAVMGHSMGGATTLHLCAEYPELVGRAILEDAGAYQITPPSDNAAPPRSDLAVWVSEMQNKTREEIMAIGRQQSPLWDEEEFGPWADAKLQLRPQAMGVRAPRPPWRETFAKVQCPLLLIRADNDKGSSVTPEAAAEAARINPLVQVVHIPGAGHNVRREQFEPFVAAVRAFLAEK